MMKIFASFRKFYITVSKHTSGKRGFSKKLPLKVYRVLKVMRKNFSINLQ